MPDTITKTEIFIPVVPDKKNRLGMMVSQALPGFILVISVIGGIPSTVGAFLLNAFCVISGLLVIFFSVREFKFPGKKIKPGTDMVTVFTGLLMIAQGSQIFNALKGFQPAHLYFLAGALFIFKGVMLPEGKIRRGFIISDQAISYNDSLIRPAVKIIRENLIDVYAKGISMHFCYKDGSVSNVNMRGKANLNEMADALKRNLFHGG